MARFYRYLIFWTLTLRRVSVSVYSIYRYISISVSVPVSVYQYILILVCTITDTYIDAVSLYSINISAILMYTVSVSGASVLTAQLVTVRSHPLSIQLRICIFILYFLYFHNDTILYLTSIHLYVEQCHGAPHISAVCISLLFCVFF